MMINDLILITGADIYLDKYNLTIEQPTMQQIALAGGEESLFQGLNMFFISSEPLEEFFNNLEEISEEEKDELKSQITAYDSLLFLLQAYSQTNKEELKQILGLINRVFSLITPELEFKFNIEKEIMLLSKKEDSYSIVVDRELFLLLKEITNKMFLLETFFKDDSQKDMSEAAKKIAEKMAKAEEKIKKEQGEKGDGQFALILSILGVKHSLDYLRGLTLYQLYNQFERFQLHSQNDQAIKAALAGVKDVKMVDWYKKI